MSISERYRKYLLGEVGTHRFKPRRELGNVFFAHHPRKLCVTGIVIAARGRRIAHIGCQDDITRLIPFGR